MLQPQQPLASSPEQLERASKLLARVRQRTVFRLRALASIGAAAVLCVGVFSSIELASASARAGKMGLWLSLFSGAGVWFFFGAYWVQRRVGDELRTARLLAQKLPEVQLDLLAAVEISRALGQQQDFSPDLARAFLRTVDAKLAKSDASKLVDTRAVRWALIGLLVLTALLGVLAWKWRESFTRGFDALTARATKSTVRREPITGDVSLTYRFPAYTGLAPRTVEGSSGDVSAVAGTVVSLQTRADRDVDSAALEVNGERIPMQKKGKRELSGEFVLDKPGQYHFIFLDSGSEVAEGPDLPIRIEADQAPEVKLLAPEETVELDPEKQSLELKYDVFDDFGVSKLELVYQAPGRPEGRLALSHDDGRSTKGRYVWDASGLKLTPGQTVSYFLEARDNNDVKGAQKGVSRTQSFKLYSAAEHRAAALEKIEALWERLVTQLADRMESKDRTATSMEEVKAGTAIDERGLAWAADSQETAAQIGDERDVPTELADALFNSASQVRTFTSATAGARRLVGYLDSKTGSFAPARLKGSVDRELPQLENATLYLESLLDRQKIAALRDLAKQLKDDRQELSKLLEQYRQTKDDKTQAALLEQMHQLREHISQLMEKMAELSRRIRDEHLNREALEEMMQQQNLSEKLDEVEKLVREGKADEALQKMQELAMQMDQMLESLDDAADKAEEDADPELTRKFQEFSESLQKTVQEQNDVSQKTKELRDKYKEQLKQRLAQKGPALKNELIAQVAELKKDYQALQVDKYGTYFQQPHEEALQDTQQLLEALEVSDFDLAADSAARLTDKAEQLAELGANERRRDEIFHNPPAAKRESRELAERLERDAQKASEVRKKLENLFPPPGQMMGDEDKKQLQKMAQRQQALEQRSQQLQQQMDELSQMAPVFDPEAKQNLESAGQRMSEASQSLGKGDARKGYGQQQSALEQLQALQRQMENGQSGGGGGKGLPLPMRSGGRGSRGTRRDKVEIPDEDPNRASRDVRKEVIDAMKQGAPDKYKEQNKHYYEGLVR